MRGLRAGIVIAIVAAAGVAEAGSAEELAEARRLRRELDFDGALAATARAIAAGDAEPAGLIEAYRLAGGLAAGLDREAEAIGYFERVHAIDASATLPAGTSPKITAPFERARASVAAKGGAIEVAIEEETEGVVVVIARDPLGMIAGERRVAIRVAPGEAYEAVLRDAHGNVVWRRSGTRAAKPTPVKREVARPPLYARGEVWAVAAIAFAGLGGVEAFQLDRAQDEWNRLDAEGGHDFSELRDVERRGRLHATLANVGFATAAVTATVATILFVREAGRDADDSVSVVGAVSADGASIGIGGRF